MKKTWGLIILLFLIWGKPVEAIGNGSTTIVSPIRSRDLWVSRDLDLLRKQYEPIKSEGLKASWLLQYDVFWDKDLLEEIKSFDDKQEFGLFLEISSNLAREARVNYRPQRPWYKPDVVFLSGYSRSERKKMIDEMFGRYKDEFGYWPKAVGAWWIDSWSLNYMQEKYGVKIALIVADQKTTDNYGIWGQWWGSPYKASEYNILMPGNGVTIIQWALRDPELAVGEGPKFSNYSLQANDYLERGLQTDYFSNLAEKYLRETGQITVGLEVGMEGAKNLDEYARQIDWVAKRTQTVTMSEFADKFEDLDGAQVGDWQMNRNERVNEKNGEKIKYEAKMAFADYFVADENDFLDRVLPIENEKRVYFPYWALVWLLGLGLAIKNKKYKWLMWGTLFLGLGFGTLLGSKWQLGWWVFYGPMVKNLEIVQILITAGVMGMFYLIKEKKLRWLLPMAFWINPMVKIARVSIIEGEYLVGVMVSGFRFIGIGVKNGIRFLNQDFDSGVASAFLKFDLGNYWLEMLVRFLLGLAGVWLISLLSTKKKKLLLIIMAILVLIEMRRILVGEPRVVFGNI